MALDVVSGVDVRWVLQHLSSQARLEGSLTQVWPETARKFAKTKKHIYIYIEIYIHIYIYVSFLD